MSFQKKYFASTEQSCLQIFFSWSSHSFLSEFHLLLDLERNLQIHAGEHKSSKKKQQQQQKNSPKTFIYKTATNSFVKINRYIVRPPKH